jgi:cytochrome c551/c552
MTPKELAKPKDWDTPENMGKALQLTSAAIQNPVVDLLVKGVGEGIRAAKDTPAAAYKSKQKEMAALKRAVEAARAKAQEAMGIYGASDEEIRRSLGGMTVPSDEDIKLFRADMPEKAKELLERAQRLEKQYEAARRAAGEESFLKGVKSLDDLFGLVARPGATRAHLEAALRWVDRFTPARSLTEIRAGRDPSLKIREQLVKTFLGAQGKPLTMKDMMLAEYRRRREERLRGAAKSRGDLKKRELELKRKKFARQLGLDDLKYQDMIRKWQQMDGRMLTAMINSLRLSGKRGKRVVAKIFELHPDLMKKYAQGRLPEIRIPGLPPKVPGGRRRIPRKGDKTPGGRMAFFTRSFEKIKDPRKAKTLRELSEISGSAIDLSSKLKALYSAWMKGKKGRGRLQVSPELFTRLDALRKKVAQYQKWATGSEKTRVQGMTDKQRKQATFEEKRGRAYKKILHTVGPALKKAIVAYNKKAKEHNKQVVKDKDRRPILSYTAPAISRKSWKFSKGYKNALLRLAKAKDPVVSARAAQILNLLKLIRPKL